MDLTTILCAVLFFGTPVLLYQMAKRRDSRF